MDPYSLKRIQNQQVRIPRYNDLGAAADRQFKNVIILWVAAGSDRFRNFNKSPRLHQRQARRGCPHPAEN